MSDLSMSDFVIGPVAFYRAAGFYFLVCLGEVSTNGILQSKNLKP